VYNEKEKTKLNIKICLTAVKNFDNSSGIGTQDRIKVSET